jgi:peptidoglycan/xylan/chitin deacetylase (PgdA/CDA1 family)
MRPLIVCYHAVSDTWPSPLAIRPDALREQLAFFRSRGYTGLTVTDAERRRREGSLPTRTLVVTFDDGYASTLHARPVLEEIGYPATVFVPTAFADDGERLRWPGIDEWVGTPHESELESLGWGALAGLSEAGWEVGSHGLTHRVMTRLDDDALAAELLGSRLAIGERFGTCTALAYPFGLADARVSAAVRAAGYETALTLTRLHDVDEPFRRPRVELTGRETGRRLAAVLSPPAMALRRSFLARAIRSRRGEPAWLPEGA